jgi:hypothetical protein
VHVFISGDRTHDGPLAMMAWERVAKETREARPNVPLHIIMWSDGAPNQFKFTLPIWFLSKLKKLGDFDKVWWIFFASCHGKGMQDAAGAWVKSRVARAILLGGEIRSVEDFFMFCLSALTYESEGSSRFCSFTSFRKFYLLETKCLAQYRANVEHVKTWSGARLCHFFWAGMRVDVIGRKWVGCMCKSCMKEDFDGCEEQVRFACGRGIYKNLPVVEELVSSIPAQRTKDEDIKASRDVSFRMHPTMPCLVTHKHVFAVYEAKE